MDNSGMGSTDDGCGDPKQVDPRQGDPRQPSNDAHENPMPSAHDDSDHEQLPDHTGIVQPSRGDLGTQDLENQDLEDQLTEGPVQVSASESVSILPGLDPRGGTGIYFGGANRLWTVFAVLAASLLTFMTASFLMTLVAVFVVHGLPTPDKVRDPEFMAQVAQSRVGFMLMVVAPQIALIVPCVFAAIASPVPTRKRLGLVSGNWPKWAWLCAMLATPMVGFFSGMVGSLFMEESEHLKEIGGMFRGHGQSGFLIPLALLIGATPAICEELLFRGYVQTRLTRSLGSRIRSTGMSVGASKLGTPLGIVLASAFFAAFHMDWVHIVTVFPIGLFLGWVRYRSGSLFPAMMGHFLNNVLGVVLLVFAPEDPDTATTVEMPALILLSCVLPGGIMGILGTIIASIRFGSNAPKLSEPRVLGADSELEIQEDDPHAKDPPSVATTEFQE